MFFGARGSRMKNEFSSKVIPVLFVITLSIIGGSTEHEQRSGDRGLAAIQDVAASNLKFTNSIYQILSEKEGNVIFSPISIETILALTYFGARGSTASQIAKGLHLPKDKNVIEHGFKKILHSLRSDQNITLEMANKIFTEKSMPLKKEFLTFAQRSFASTVEGVDFNTNPEGARHQINQWVESNTNNKIKDLLAEGKITVDTNFVLVNAIYFKSDWVNKFNASHTKTEPFHTTPTESKDVQMMNCLAWFNFGFSKELDSKVIELPYKGERISLVVILPNNIDGLANLEANLAKVDLKHLLDTLEKTDIRVSLPKFKLEQFIELNDILKKLGMVDMFEKVADFSGLTNAPVSITEVVHKATIEVDEEGSEASAATGVVSDRRSLPPRFEANHPFVFAIFDKRIGTPLFLGRFTG